MNQRPMTDHDNAYAELLGSDDSQWAFGHDFEDPLAGVDTTVPAGLLRWYGTATPPAS